MIDVLFENAQKIRRSIGRVESLDDAYKLVFDFCKEHDFDIPYTRVTPLDSGEIWLDVGSHTEFFYFVVENNDMPIKERRFVEEGEIHAR